MGNRTDKIDKEKIALQLPGEMVEESTSTE